MPKDSRLRKECLLVRSKARILATGDFLTPEELARFFANHPRLSSAVLKKWEQEHRIFSIDQESHVLYPSYAFSSNGELLTGLKDVVMLLSTSKGGWGLAFWFGSSNSYLGGALPRDELSSNPNCVLSAAVNEVRGALHG